MLLHDIDNSYNHNHRRLNAFNAGADDDLNMDVISVDELGMAEDDEDDVDLDVDVDHHDDEDMLLEDEDDDDEENSFLSAPSVCLRHQTTCERIVECLASASSVVREVWLGPSFASVETAANALRVLPHTVTVLDLDLRSLPSADIARTIWPILVRRSHLISVTLRVPHPHVVSALAETMVMARAHFDKIRSCVNINANTDGKLTGHANVVVHTPALLQWKALDLCGNRIDDQAVRHLAEALPALAPGLTRLNLSCNEISDGVAVARFLTTLNHLERFEINFNSIDDASMWYICNALRDSRSQLRTLNLFGCQRLSRVGIQYLADCLEYYNTTLWHANIFACGYYQQDAQERQKPLHAEQSPTITSISTESSPAPLTHQLGSQIHNWLLLNRSGRYLLRDEGTPLAIRAPLLAKINDRPDAIYFHLRQIPRIFMR